MGKLLTITTIAFLAFASVTSETDAQRRKYEEDFESDRYESEVEVLVDPNTGEEHYFEVEHSGGSSGSSGFEYFILICVGLWGLWYVIDLIRNKKCEEEARVEKLKAEYTEKKWLETATKEEIREVYGDLD